MDRSTIPTEARRDLVAGHFRRVAQLERMTLGELYRHQRAIIDGINACQQHQQRAYREDVIGVLGELDYCLGTHSSGCPAIYWNPCAESDLAELLMCLGSDLRTRAPRKWSSICSSVRLDLKRCVLWFDLPSEPADDIPYEAAA